MICPNDVPGGSKMPDTSNLFRVVNSPVGDYVQFRYDGPADGIPWYFCRIKLPRRAALNLAVWLAAMADPGRLLFDRMFQEINKPPKQ